MLVDCDRNGADGGDVLSIDVDELAAPLTLNGQRRQNPQRVSRSPRLPLPQSSEVERYEPTLKLYLGSALDFSYA
jgi:hypothetical protein